MNPYLLTLTFLTVMSLFTSSEMVSFVASSHSLKMHDHYAQTLLAAEKARAERELELFRASNPDPLPCTPSEPGDHEPTDQIPSLDYDPERPPNNSRINFYLVLHGTLHKDLPPESTPYKMAARLMRILYGSAPFYYAGAEREILDKLLEKKSESEGFYSPDQLSSIAMDHPKLQHLFYAMLKGSDGYPPLLDFITYDEEGSREMQKINLMFASEEVVRAAIDHPHLAERLLAMRNQTWTAISEQSEGQNRTYFKTNLTEEFKKNLDSLGLNFENYKWLFDLSLGKKGTILFKTDPKTGLTHRQKII